MELTPRKVAPLAFLALVPFVIYGVQTGDMRPLTWIVGVVNIFLIATTLLLGFGPAESLTNGAGSGH